MRSSPLAFGASGRAAGFLESAAVGASFLAFGASGRAARLFESFGAFGRLFVFLFHGNLLEF